MKTNRQNSQTKLDELVGKVLEKKYIPIIMEVMTEAIDMKISKVKEEILAENIQLGNKKQVQQVTENVEDIRANLRQKMGMDPMGSMTETSILSSNNAQHLGGTSLTGPGNTVMLSDEAGNQRPTRVPDSLADVFNKDYSELVKTFNKGK